VSVRATVTLDDDVLAKVKRESRRRGQTFRDTLNDLLRAALLTSDRATPRTFEIKPVSMGFREGIDYDDIEGLIDLGEGEQHR
jgi:hypothetical protein